jgi:hypothetical protein
MNFDAISPTPLLRAFDLEGFRQRASPISYIPSAEMGTRLGGQNRGLAAGLRKAKSEPSALARKPGEQSTALSDESLVRRASFGVPGEFALQAIEEEHLMRPVMLGDDRHARLKLK